MSRTRAVLAVLSDPESLPAVPGLERIAASQFLTTTGALPERVPVVNLCHGGGYLSLGWYVSLLAEARGGVPLPEPALLEARPDRRGRDRALREEGVDVLDVDELARRARKNVEAGVPLGEGPLVADSPEATVYRPARAEEIQKVTLLAGQLAPGTPALPGLRVMGRRVFAAWPLPLCSLHLVRDASRWRLIDLEPVDVSELDTASRRALAEALASTPAVAPEPPTGTPSLAVLWDASDASVASTPETLERLARVGREHGLRVEVLNPDDLERLGDHDALFIRTLTGVDQPAWRFANRAEALGMPVIDSPTAIVRCGNKVYLHELLSRAGLATPATIVFGHEASWASLSGTLGAPLVVKVPDGSFSSAVFRVTDEADFNTRIPPLLERSPLLVAQTWMPTDFDWRIGVLDRRILFAARYHMVPGHWQIRALQGRSVRFGRVEAVPRDQVPSAVRRLSLAAANLLGDGLFGVDLKVGPDGQPVVIEVNDNPNLELGYEDAADGDIIYADIVRWYKRRLGVPRPRPVPRAGSQATVPPLRRPIGRAAKPPERPYKAWEVVGLELEYPVVDRDLNVLHVAEGALSALGGRPCSDVELGRVGVSNELFKHVLELKNILPHKSLRRAEDDLVEGVRRVNLLLGERFRGRLLPGGMHPWMRPTDARIWNRSNRRIYDTYARLFEVHTHGWANVQAVHVNLPAGTPEESVAMLNAARHLVPYLPAIAASSPLVEGELTGKVDNRVAWLLEHQARLPESMARLVPEPLVRFSDYKRDILGPMYAAVDRLPDAQALRAEFLNARGAVFKMSRASMEVRILDVQECVLADVSIAWYVRRALRWLSRNVAVPADQRVLEADLLATATHGSRAMVLAPHLPLDPHRDAQGRVEARAVHQFLLSRMGGRLPAEEQRYADVMATIIANGSLAERLLARLQPVADRPASADNEFTELARRLWIELADCLVENRLWTGRTAADQTVTPSRTDNNVSGD